MNLIEAFEAEANLFTTENGMPYHRSTGSALLDLFSKIGSARAGMNKRLKNMVDLSNDFDKAFAENAVWTIRVLLWARDIRGGAGERETVRRLLKRLEKQHPEVIVRLIPKLVEVGRWDDILVFETDVVKRAAFDHLKAALDAGNGLAAKWAPRINSKRQEVRRLAREIAAQWGLTERQYRKLIVAKSNVIEQDMSAKQWSNIDYEKVPSLASIRYKNAFARNDASRYAEFNSKVESGEAKVNSAAVFPHNIVDAIRRDGASTPVHEAMWEGLPDYTNDTSVFPLVDVSGSMGTFQHARDTDPITVSVALGLYLSMKNKGPFRDAFMTFESKPDFVKLSGNLSKRIKSLANAPWGGSTNITAAFDKLLDVATRNAVSAEDMPKSIVILSDMQFDENAIYGCMDASGGFFVDDIRQRYQVAGMTCRLWFSGTLANRLGRMSSSINGASFPFPGFRLRT